MQTIVRYFIGMALYCYYLLLLKTLRFKIEGKELLEQEIAQGKAPVLASAHGMMLPGILAFDGLSCALLASLSGDGELAARLLKRRGFEMVRGSSSRGGKSALEQLLHCLSKGLPVAITFDGPKGPPLIPKAGVAVCAAAASGSTFLLIVKPLSPWLYVKLHSWDRFLLPLPFCKVTIQLIELKIDAVPKNSPIFIEKFLQHLKVEAEKAYFYYYESNKKV